MMQGTCPVCNGTGRMSAVNEPFRTVFRGYDLATNTLPCTNCGAQTMSGTATGKVTLREDGTPCVHEYKGRAAGRCLTVYTCLHCSHRFDIDSSD